MMFLNGEWYDPFEGYASHDAMIKYSPKYNNVEAQRMLNKFVEIYLRKNGYKIYCFSGHHINPNLCPCRIYVMKYDGRMKKEKPVLRKPGNYEETFDISMKFFCEQSNKAAAGVVWKRVQQDKYIEKLEYLINS